MGLYWRSAIKTLNGMQQLNKLGLNIQGTFNKELLADPITDN